MSTKTVDRRRHPTSLPMPTPTKCPLDPALSLPPASSSDDMGPTVPTPSMSEFPALPQPQRKRMRSGEPCPSVSGPASMETPMEVTVSTSNHDLLSRMRSAVQREGTLSRDAMSDLHTFMSEAADSIPREFAEYIMGRILDMGGSYARVAEILSEAVGCLTERAEVETLIKEVVRSPSVGPLPPIEAAWSTVLRRKRPTAGTAAPSALASFPSLPPSMARPGVLFFPTGENKASDNTKAALKTAVRPETLGVRITGVRNVRNSGIIVHPRTSKEAKALLGAPGRITR